MVRLFAKAYSMHCFNVHFSEAAGVCASCFNVSICAVTVDWTEMRRMIKRMYLID
jgi:hypothetical protein